MEHISRLEHRFELFPDDIFLVSYPKSGNTWLRFLFGNYLGNNSCSFQTLFKTSGDVYSMTSEAAAQMSRPRLIKSHEPYTTDYKKVVYLVRDARDVAVSYYHFKQKFRGINNIPFSEFLELFNSGAIATYANWNLHVNSWLDSGLADLLIVKYEDMVDDTAHEFEKILDFCRIPIDHQKVVAAVNASAFEAMQRAEQQEQNLLKNWNASDTSIQFVRQGGYGNWESWFTDSLLDAFITVHGDALARLDYITASEFRRSLQAQEHPHFQQQAIEHQNTKLVQLETVYGRTKEKLSQSKKRIKKIQTRHTNLKKKVKHLQRQKKNLEARVNHLTIEPTAAATPRQLSSHKNNLIQRISFCIIQKIRKTWE